MAIEKVQPKGRILVIDDEWGIRDILANILASEGFDVETAGSGVEGIRKLDADVYDLVITDLKMPDVSGIEILRHLSKQHVHTLGVVATGHSTIESAVSALRLGAFDYVTKPFHLDEIKLMVRRAMEVLDLRAENLTLRRALRRSGHLENMVGAAPVMKRLHEMIQTVADSDAAVLVLGESGTGKELTARAIHYNSPRADQPLVPVNCGAIPEELLESELFGHVKGAFTGAVQDRPGRFQMANEGTIFLDEIGDMSPSLQVKLLRVLQDQVVEPVGATRNIRVNVRLIAATHRDLEDEVREGRFRKDLFYRLNVIPLRVPPLRERAEDIPLLVNHFSERLAEASGGRRIVGLTPEVERLLSAHDWPGNVRELENLVERLTVLHSGEEIRVEHLPETFRETMPEGTSRKFSAVEIPDEGVNLNDLLRRFEGDLIDRALKKTDGVKSDAAALLGLKRTTLVERMKKRSLTG